MSIATEKITKYSGFQLHTVKTEKFKTNTIVVKWRTPITKENSTHRALLPYVMQNSTKKYPTTAKLRSFIEELYGATFLSILLKKGNTTLFLSP